MNNFIVFSYGYNCDQWTTKNMLSVQKQDYVGRVNHIIVDDSKERIGWWASAKEKLLPILKDDDVVIILGQQNWFSDPYSLSIIDRYYNMGCWMTYGSAIESTAEMKVPEEIITIPYSTLLEKKHRLHQWKFYSPVTMYGSIFSKLTDYDFTLIDGSIVKAAYDMAMSYPLMDIVPPGRIAFIDYILTVENKEYIDSLYDEEAKDDFFREKIPHERMGDDEADTLRASELIVFPVIITKEDIKKYRK